MLRRASVFAGGWTIDAAERVCSDEPSTAADALDLLTSLTDKSLVVADTHGEATRFDMLETVRHYAQDRLRERSEEALVHARHVEYFVDAAEKLAAQQNDADLQAKLIRLDKEHDNLRAALAWCEADRALLPERAAARRKALLVLESAGPLQRRAQLGRPALGGHIRR